MYTSPGANVPGAIVKATTLYKPKPKIDPRLDILLDVGLILDGDEKVTAEGDGWQLIVGAIRNQDDQAAVAYYVIVGTEGIYQEVFDATIIDRVIEYQKYSSGVWEKHLTLLSEMRRRDKFLKLVAGGAV